MLRDERKLSVFPAFFGVKDRPVLVVGSGAEALAKIRLVAETSALIVAVAPDPAPCLYACLKHMAAAGGAVKWLDAPFDSAMLAGAALVFAASGDDAHDSMVAAAARQARIPVNVVDRPAMCDFFTPALVNRAPVAVAIGTEGTGPVLAQYIRARIDALLYPGIGKLARLAGRLRGKVEQCVPKGGARRRFWRLFFDGAPARAMLEGDEKAAGKHALKLLADLQAGGHPVRLLYAGHGMADWLTLAGQRALMEADTIVHDDDAARDILAMARRDAGLLSVSPVPRLSVQLVQKLYGKGDQVLRLVTDEARLAEEAALLGACGLSYELLPSLTGGMRLSVSGGAGLACPAAALMPHGAEQAA